MIPAGAVVSLQKQIRDLHNDALKRNESKQIPYGISASVGDCLVLFYTLLLSRYPLSKRIIVVPIVRSDE